MSTWTEVATGTSSETATRQPASASSTSVRACSSKPWSVPILTAWSSRTKPKRPSFRRPTTPSPRTSRDRRGTSWRSANDTMVTARHDAAAAVRKSSGLHMSGSVPRNSGGVAIEITGLPSMRADVRRPPSQVTSAGKWNSRGMTPPFGCVPAGHHACAARVAYRWRSDAHTIEQSCAIAGSAMR